MAKSARGMANKIASKGRHGDTMLMHVSPAEVSILEGMNPGSITRNPDTGQPEAWAWLAGLLAKTGAAAQAAGGLVGGAVKSGLGALQSAGGGVKDMLGAGVPKTLESGLGRTQIPMGGIGAPGQLGYQSVMGRMAGAGRDMLKAGGPQNYLSKKMGIPTDAQGLVGMAGEKLGVSPVITEGVQDIMSMPPSGVPGQQQEQMDRQSMQRDKMNKMLQPASVPIAASRQINRQGGVRNLVAQRFGEGSPITKYIGSYEHPGSYTAPDNGRQENITATIEPGETVHFMGDPDAPDPMSQLSGDIHQPLMGSPGNYRFPDQSKGVHASGTDIFRPNQRKTSGLEKALGWMGFAASQLQGKLPSERFSEGRAWSLGQDYRKELERIELQAHEEGRDLTLPERNVMNAMRNRIGESRQETYKPGERRTVTAQVAGKPVPDPLGQNRRMVMDEFFSPREGFVSSGDPYAAEAAEAPDKSDDKVLRAGGSEVATKQWNPATRKKQFQVWDEETQTLSWHDTPQESNWRPVQSGFGDAAVAKLKGDDRKLIAAAKGVKNMLDTTGYEEDGALKDLHADKAKILNSLRNMIFNGSLSSYSSPANAEMFNAVRLRLYEMFGAHVGDDFTLGKGNGNGSTEVLN